MALSNRFIIEDENGNKFYPHSFAEVVHTNDGGNVEEKIKELKAKDVAQDGQISILYGENNTIETLEQLNNLINVGNYVLYPNTNFTVDGFTFLFTNVYIVKVSRAKLREGSYAITQDISGCYPISTSKIVLTRTYLDSWNTMKQLATTDKVDILFPYGTGFVDYNTDYKTLISKDSTGRVVCNFYVKKTGGNFTASYETVGTLPSGFIPKTNIEIVCRGSGSMYGVLSIEVTGRVLMAKMGGDDGNYLSGTVIFDCK